MQAKEAPPSSSLGARVALDQDHSRTVVDDDTSSTRSSGSSRTHSSRSCPKLRLELIDGLHHNAEQHTVEITSPHHQHGLTSSAGSEEGDETFTSPSITRSDSDSSDDEDDGANDDSDGSPDESDDDEYDEEYDSDEAALQSGVAVEMVASPTTGRLRMLASVSPSSVSSSASTTQSSSGPQRASSPSKLRRAKKKKTQSIARNKSRHRKGKKSRGNKLSSSAFSSSSIAENTDSSESKKHRVSTTSSGTSSSSSSSSSSSAKKSKRVSSSGKHRSSKADKQKKKRRSRGESSSRSSTTTASSGHTASLDPSASSSSSSAAAAASSTSALSTSSSSSVCVRVGTRVRLVTTDSYAEAVPTCAADAERGTSDDTQQTHSFAASSASASSCSPSSARVALLLPKKQADLIVMPSPRGMRVLPSSQCLPAPPRVGRAHERPGFLERTVSALEQSVSPQRSESELSSDDSFTGDPSHQRATSSNTSTNNDEEEDVAASSSLVATRSDPGIASLLRSGRTRDRAQNGGAGDTAHYARNVSASDVLRANTVAVPHISSADSLPALPMTARPHHQHPTAEITAVLQRFAPPDTTRGLPLRHSGSLNNLDTMQQRHRSQELGAAASAGTPQREGKKSASLRKIQDRQQQLKISIQYLLEKQFELTAASENVERGAQTNKDLKKRLEKILVSEKEPQFLERNKTSPRPLPSPRTLSLTPRSNKKKRAAPKTIASLIEWDRIELTKLLAPQSLASGCMVYEATMNDFGAVVKDLDLLTASDYQVIGFKNEVQVLSQLPPHPNLVKYLHHDLKAGHLRLFMTLYDSTLRHVINKRTESTEWNLFCPRTIFQCMLDICKGMDFLSSFGIIHRDLKSENVFVTMLEGETFGNLSIGDFDSCWPVRSSAPEALPSDPVGTIGWIAPEVLCSKSGLKYYGPEADVYSFGCICYELITLLVPYHDCKFYIVSKKVLAGERPVIPNHIRLDLQYLPCIEIFRECTSVNPKKRPTFLNLETRLEQLLKDF
eukprot:CAMPEP_0174248576 /NCGR_PEP_ID=MMETSP0417-20130205/43147_1 /TAXON_ID=242541 /ORGANISM="Mayorella sp, Strain BSH-02190019" /LENGTH=1011 /DNA_ID=CAMNT_0015328441 /DNA_START=36 /DNA_END=3071 /DNA_ORIENTATION=+